MTRTLRTGPPRRPRPAPTALAGAALCLALLAAAPAGAARQPVRSGELLPGIVARIHADGTLEISGGPAADEALLDARLEAPAADPRLRGRRRDGDRPGAVRLDRAAEGCPGGLRGFSARADDDGDGLVDEDRLDGRDNDGDGLVDEDFAAVSDAMIAFTRGDGAHLEYYHWGHARLQGTVFAAVDGAAGAHWALTTGGTPWLEADLAATRHSVTGRPEHGAATAFVSRIDPGGDCRAGGRWLGVAVLDDPRPDGTGRAILDGRDLAVAIGPEPVAVAVCAAESWLQLARRLTDAARIRTGVTDPVTGDRASWVVAPACPVCRGSGAPPWTWRVERTGDLVLTAHLGDEGRALPDPDLLRVAGLPLGAPSRLVWRPRGGEERGVAWACATPEGLLRGTFRGGDPFGRLDGICAHDAVGRLELRFVDPDPAVVAALSGGPTLGDRAREVAVTGADGRFRTAALEPALDGGNAMRAALALVRSGAEAEGGTSPARQSQLLRSGRVRPQLAPDLLQGWPNPFRDVISVRFRVPASVDEAFAWDDAADRPAGLDLAAPVPWRSGLPDATVKIYTMSGQELVTLYTGQAGAGETVMTWDGSDAYGRKVASGTYFCKLQLDEWSVTRRLVYLR